MDGGIGSRQILTSGKRIYGAVMKEGAFSMKGFHDNLPKGGDAAAMPLELSHGQIVDDPKRMIFSRAASLAERYEAWRDGTSRFFSKIDLAPDLADNIGSARWLRGIATLIGLSALALAGWPQFAPLKAAPSMLIDDAGEDEFRSQMIMPLALGADSGRQMRASSLVRELDRAPERPRLDLVATLAGGEGFDRMLIRAGVGPAEADLLAGMVARAVPLSDVPAGTQVDITLGRRPEPSMPRPLDALSFRARFDLQMVVERRYGRLVADPRPIKVDTTPLRIRGKVGPSLYRAARASGAPPRAVQQYLRALGDEMDLNRAIGSADEFDLIVEYKRAETGEVEAGQLLYAGLWRAGKPRKQLMRWGPDNRFYEASGAGETRQGLMAPVSGRVTSRYGMRRHPILGYRRMHRGLDFKARHGTPIHAVTDGTVQFAGRNGGHGNFVKLSHNGGLATGYAHMSRIAVSRGARVRRGQVIGYVGSTGLSTGPHLHYEMYRGGRTVDPSSVRFVTRAQLSGTELVAFRNRLAQLQEVEPGAALATLEAGADEGEAPVREIDRLNNRQNVG